MLGEVSPPSLSLPGDQTWTLDKMQQPFPPCFLLPNHTLLSQSHTVCSKACISSHPSPALKHPTLLSSLETSGSPVCETVIHRPDNTTVTTLTLL